jgi:hypothetical protein
VKERVPSISGSLCARRLEIVVVRARLLVMKEGEGFLWRRTVICGREVTPLGSEFTSRRARSTKRVFKTLAVALNANISSGSLS